MIGINAGQLMCNMGLHKVVTTREGKPPASVRSGTPSGAAAHIHCFCHRPACKFHVIIDTHSGEKILHEDTNGVRLAG